MNQQQNNNYRIIILSNEASFERSLLGETTCILRINDIEKSTRMPFHEAIVFDLEDIDPSHNINILLEKNGKPYAKGQIAVPAAVATSAELERQELIDFEVLDQSMQGPIKVSFLILYLNRTMYAIKKSAEKASEARRQTPTKTIIASSPGGNSNEPTHRTTGSTPKKAPAQKDKRLTSEELRKYLDKVVEKYTTDSKLLSDNRGVEESMYLNMFQKMIEAPEGNELMQSQSMLQSSKDAEMLVQTPMKHVMSLHELEITPEKLKERYESPAKQGTRKSSRGKQRSGGPGDLTSMMFEVEAKRHQHELVNQIEYLKTVIYSLDIQVRENTALKRENDVLRKQLAKSEEARTLLQHSVHETTQEMKQEFDNVVKENQQLIHERNSVSERIRDLNAKLSEMSQILDKERQVRLRLEAENVEASTKMRLFNELRSQLEAARKELANTEQNRTNLQNEMQNRMRDLNRTLDVLREQSKNLTVENSKLLNDLNDLQHQLLREKTLNQEKNAEIENLNRKLLANEADSLLLAEVQKQRDGLANQLAQTKLANGNFEKILEDYSAEASNQAKQNETALKRCLEENAQLQRRNENLQASNNDLQTQMHTYQKEISSLRGNVSTLEQLLLIKSDQAAQTQNTQENLLQALKDKEALRQQLEMNSEQLLNQEEKNYDLQKLIIYLKGVVSEKEDYILNLKKLIVEMKEKSAIYVPVRDDPVDSRLAEYLNNVQDPNKLKVLFIRESDGVYQFGNKKVYVKVEGEKIMIRVGGGFLTIDEFLEKHVPLELERMHRNDPVKVLTTNLAVHKTISGRAVNEFEKPKMNTLPIKEPLILSKSK